MKGFTLARGVKTTSLGTLLIQYESISIEIAIAIVGTGPAFAFAFASSIFFLASALALARLFDRLPDLLLLNTGVLP